MKTSLVEYITILANNDYDCLCDIVENKYRKFILLYWLLRKYSEDIKDLSYIETEGQYLDIDLKVTKGKLTTIVNALMEENDNETISITASKTHIHISIIKEDEI